MELVVGSLERETMLQVVIEAMKTIGTPWEETKKIAIKIVAYVYARNPLKLPLKEKSLISHNLQIKQPK